MSSVTNTGNTPTTPVWKIAALWLMVTLPAAWGFIETLTKAVTLFTG